MKKHFHSVTAITFKMFVNKQIVICKITEYTIPYNDQKKKTT